MSMQSVCDVEAILKISLMNVQTLLRGQNFTKNIKRTITQL